MTTTATSHLPRGRTLLVLACFLTASWAVAPYFAGLPFPIGVLDVLGVSVWLLDHPLRGLATLPWFALGLKMVLYSPR